MTLPYDYARCGSSCELAAFCRRTDAGRPGYQAIAFFEGGNDCSGYIKRFPSAVRAVAPMTPAIQRGIQE